MRCLPVLLGALLWAAPIHAQSDATRAAARDLGTEGVEAYQAGQYAVASEKLSRAFEILRVPTLGVWSARALVKVGKLVEASERYVVVSRLDTGTGDVALQKQALADALTEREALQARIPSLTIELKGAPERASVTLDAGGVPKAMLGIRLPANPGQHTASAHEDGRSVSKQFNLAEGQKLTITLDFAQAVATNDVPSSEAPKLERGPEPAAPTSAPVAPAEAPAADRPSGGLPAGFWVGVAVAGAGLATGGVTALLASQKKDDLACPNNQCAPAQRDDVDSHNQLLTLSTIGFIAGGVGAATAGVFLLTRPKPQATAKRVVPWVGVGAAGVRGTF